MADRDARRHYGDAFLNDGRFWIWRPVPGAWGVISPEEPDAPARDFPSFAAAVAYVRGSMDRVADVPGVVSGVRVILLRTAAEADAYCLGRWGA